MAWKTADPTRTRHSDTCERVWNRYDTTCPRCRELAAGAAPHNPLPKAASRRPRRPAHLRKRANRGPAASALLFGVFASIH